jgi:hypothetical protein
MAQVAKQKLEQTTREIASHATRANALMDARAKLPSLLATRLDDMIINGELQRRYNEFREKAEATTDNGDTALLITIRDLMVMVFQMTTESLGRLANEELDAGARATRDRALLESLISQK